MIDTDMVFPLCQNSGRRFRLMVFATISSAKTVNPGMMVAFFPFVKPNAPSSERNRGFYRLRRQNRNAARCRGGLGIFKATLPSPFTGRCRRFRA
ncbi:MAG: hypothetical protein WDN06_15380 [Asticcacaulis sp.]